MTVSREDILAVSTEVAERVGKAVADNMVKGNQPAMLDKAVGHQGTLLHGPGGLFNTPGLDEAMISTHVRARGLGQLLTAFPTTDTNPFFGVLTGFGDATSTEPDGPCDPAPTSFMKSGTLTAKYGHVARDTRQIRITDTLKTVNRGDFTDIMLLNSVLNQDSSGIYYPSDLNEAGLIDMVVKAEQVTAGVSFERKASVLLWTGDGSGTNDTANDGYVEPPGLDSQIATGQLDAEDGTTLLPSLDSTIIDLNFAQVGSTDIVAPIEEMEDKLWNLSVDTGMDPVTWVIVMRPMLWREISSVWPIQYNTQPDMSLLAGTEARVLLDARANIDQRDQMRQGMFLDVNGRRYNVVLDTGIVQLDIADGGISLVDEWASSIYFVPLTAVNGFPITYWQYLDQKLGVPQSNLLPSGMETWWTDAGRFLWSYDGAYSCFTLKMESDFRVVLRAPHLAGKIQNVKWVRESTRSLRDPDPASSYWVDGGISSPPGRSGPSHNAVWG